MIKNFQNNMLIGLWAGSIAGFIILFVQSLLEVYGQQNNMLFAFAIILGINLLIIFCVAYHNSKKEKRK